MKHFQCGSTSVLIAFNTDTTWVASPGEVIETTYLTSTTYNTIWTPVIIPTSPGFVPIQSDPKFVPKLKARATKAQQQANRIAVGAPDSPQPMNLPQYPQRVDCTSTVRSASTNVVRVTVYGLKLTLFVVTKTQWSTAASTTPHAVPEPLASANHPLLEGCRATALYCRLCYPMCCMRWWFVVLDRLGSAVRGLVFGVSASHEEP